MALGAILWKHDGESEMASQKRQQYSTCAQDSAGSRIWSFLSPATEPQITQSMQFTLWRHYREKSRNALALAKGRREDGDVEKTGMIISLGNRQKESGSSKMGLCLIQSEL